MAPSGEHYEVKAGVVCLQVKLCDSHLSALEVMFSRQSAIQIYVYLTLTSKVIVYVTALFTESLDLAIGTM